MGTSAVDNSPGVTATRWSPPLGAVVVAWLLAIAAAAGAAFTTRNAGQVLLAVAALVLLAAAVHGTLARPRLTVNERGVTVRGLTGARELGWAELDVRVRRTKRLGRITTTLELEHGESMFVLGRIDLGAEPEDVADVLLALRP